MDSLFPQSSGKIYTVYLHNYIYTDLRFNLKLKCIPAVLLFREGGIRLRHLFSFIISPEPSALPLLLHGDYQNSVGVDLRRALEAGFRIHDILVWIRIRGSMPLTNGSRSGFGTGSCYFHHWPSRRQQKFITF